MKRPLPLLTTQTRHTSQDGSILISLAGALLLLMVLLGSIQIGYAYYQERDLQKAADLAALSGVQVLSAGDCDDAKTRAQEIAKGNVPDFDSKKIEVKSTCGRWDATPSTASFVTDEATPNALRTTIKLGVPILIPFISKQTVEVHATALSTEPVAAFSVGSRLLRLDKTGLLGAILKGAGLDVDKLDVLSAEGIANIGITPSGLLKELGLPTTVLADIGTPDQLARVKQLNLADLLAASFNLVGRSTATDDHIDAVQALLRQIEGLSSLNVPIKLIGEHGIFATVDAANLDSALNTQVNLLDILSTGIVLANGENFARIALPAAPLLGDTLTAAIQIVEPPTLAVGGVGTRAQNAQVKVNLNLDIDLSPLAKIHLPIFIKIASSTGELTKICEAPLAPDEAIITVPSEDSTDSGAGIANICIGGPGISTGDTSNAAFDNAFNACNMAEYPLLEVLGIPILKGPFELDLGTPSHSMQQRLTAFPSSNSTKTFPESGASSLNLLSSILNGDKNGKKVGISTVDRERIAADLVGPTPGIPISAAIKKFQKQSTDSIAGVDPGLRLGLLSGTVNLVENVVGPLLTTVNDLVCSLHLLNPEAMRQCRVTAVKNVLFGTEEKGQGITAPRALTALSPILNSLDTVLNGPNGLINTLGLNLGETDVTLHSVQCGVPRLVE